LLIDLQNHGHLHRVHLKSKGAINYKLTAVRNFVKSQPNSFTAGKRREFPTKPMYYFSSYLNYVAALPLRIQKFKFGENLEENANKKCHDEPVSNFHNYRKKKP